MCDNRINGKGWRCLSFVLAAGVLAGVAEGAVTVTGPSITVNLGQVQTGSVNGRITFRVETNTEKISLRVAATHLYKGNSASSSYQVPLGGPGVSVVPATGGSDSGDDSLAWETPVALNSMSGWQTCTGQFTSNQGDQFSQDVMVSVRWDQDDPEMPVGYYCGYVKLVVEAGDQSGEAVAPVYVQIVPNTAVSNEYYIVVGTLQPVVSLGDLQPGQIPAQVTFTIDAGPYIAGEPTINLQVFCTHLYKDGSPTAVQTIPVAGPGAFVQPENGNEIRGGFDNLLEWETAYTTPEGARGSATVVGAFESGQAYQFSQNVTVRVVWNATNNEVAPGEYSGYVRLVGSIDAPVGSPAYQGPSEAWVRVYGSVPDTTPPLIELVSASPDVLTPPNHKMVSVAVNVEAVDDSDPAPESKITGVTCDEPISGPGDGGDPDWQFTDDPLVVLLRAETSGSPGGRVYTIHVSCTDASGNQAKGTVDVTVQRDRGKGKKGGLL